MFLSDHVTPEQQKVLQKNLWMVFVRLVGLEAQKSLLGFMEIPESERTSFGVGAVSDVGQTGDTGQAEGESQAGASNKAIRFGLRRLDRLAWSPSQWSCSAAAWHVYRRARSSLGTAVLSFWPEWNCRHLRIRRFGDRNPEDCVAVVVSEDRLLAVGNGTLFLFRTDGRPHVASRQKVFESSLPVRSRPTIVERSDISER